MAIHNYRIVFKDSLFHYGVKGQKWGVRNGPPYPIKRDFPGINDHSIIVHTISKSHKSNPIKSTPNSIMDRISDNPNRQGVSERSFYGSDGFKYKDIHTSHHGHPKQHDFDGKNGEHVVEFKWNEDGSLRSKKSRALTPYERRENSDIL